jgi:mercuric ion binding protein
MKRIWRQTFLIVSLFLMSPATIAAQQAYRLHVDGLACPFCAYGIEKKLTAIKNVQKVGVEIATGTVTVTMAEGASLDEAMAKQAVKDAGFTLRGFAPMPAAQSK